MATSTGIEAISAFEAAYTGGLCYCWEYSPNGSPAMGEDSWINQESVRAAIENRDTVTNEVCDWEAEDYSASWDGEELTLAHTPPRSKHTYFTLKPGLKSEFEGKEVVACHGAHYGFMWGSSCEEIDSYDLPDRLQTDTLEKLLRTGDYDGSVGVEELGDPTDDGTNYAVVNPERFQRAAELCERIERFLEDAEDYSDEAKDFLVQKLGEKLEKETA